MNYLAVFTYLERVHTSSLYAFISMSGIIIDKIHKYCTLVDQVQKKVHGILSFWFTPSNDSVPIMYFIVLQLLLIFKKEV